MQGAAVGGRGRANVPLVASSPDEDAEYQRRRLARTGDGVLRATPDKVFTRDEVSRHCVESDCWIVVSVRPKGRERQGPTKQDIPTVFDVTEFLKLHPGGEKSIMAYAGRDCTSYFYRVHSNNAFTLPFYSPFIKPLGVLAGAGSGSRAAEKQEEKTQRARLLVAQPLTHDTKRLVLELPTADGQRLQPGGHFRLSVGGKEPRSYTPVAVKEDGRELQFVVKHYEGGHLTPLLHNMAEGCRVEVSGPYPCSFEFEHARHETVILVAGGTGAAPILSLARAVAEECRNAVCVVSDKTPADALFTEEFTELIDDDPELVSLQRVFTRVKEGGGEGALYQRLDASLLRQLLPSPSRGTVAVVCGTRNFNKEIGAAVAALGHPVTILGESE